MLRTGFAKSFNPLAEHDANIPFPSGSMLASPIPMRNLIILLLAVGTGYYLLQPIRPLEKTRHGCQLCTEGSFSLGRSFPASPIEVT